MAQSSNHATSALDSIRRLLDFARDRGASDLHLIPSERGLEVRARIDGVLVPKERIPKDQVALVIGRLKVLADLLVYRRDVPQEGRISSERSGIQTEVRVAVFPTLLGEKIALRFDARKERGLALEELGFRKEVTNALREATEEPEGVILLTGPSGSGKTTTLYACLDHLNGDGCLRNIASIEDPIERRIDGVMQTEIRPAVGLDYEAALKSILRQDPDVILLGEIRDHETARIALEAGTTGHLVASTIHAGTPANVFVRLRSMGIEPYAITSSVRAVLAQRLVRAICRGRPEGSSHADCNRCGGTGYAGRIPIATYVSMTPEIKHAILDEADGAVLDQIIARSGTSSLADEALRLVTDGLSTQEEVQRVLGSITQAPTLHGERGGSRPSPQSTGGPMQSEGPDSEGSEALVPRPDAEKPEGSLPANGAGDREREEPEPSIRG